MFLCGRLAFLATQHLVLENSSLCRLIEGRAPLPVEKPEDQILASSAFSVDRELQHMTGRLKWKLQHRKVATGESSFWKHGAGSSIHWDRRQDIAVVPVTPFLSRDKVGLQWPGASPPAAACLCPGWFAQPSVQLSQQCYGLTMSFQVSSFSWNKWRCFLRLQPKKLVDNV